MKPYWGTAAINYVNVGQKSSASKPRLELSPLHQSHWPSFSSVLACLRQGPALAHATVRFVFASLTCLCLFFINPLLSRSRSRFGSLLTAYLPYTRCIHSVDIASFRTAFTSTHLFSPLHTQCRSHELIDPSSVPSHRPYASRVLSPPTI